MRIINYCCLSLLFLFSFSIRGFCDPGHPAGNPVTYRQGDLLFEWDPVRDNARVVHLPGRSTVWEGSLLPSFWLEANHKKMFVKASVEAVGTEGNDAGGNGAGDNGELHLKLKIGTLGRGELTLSREDWGIRFSRLEIDWTGQSPALIEMYFGASDKVLKGSPVPLTWDRPFIPDWQAFGYCVPGAKEGPAQSFFRNWDFGLTNIALGSFGPSTGVPYGAAYPKPLYFAGMGSNEGFITLGAGSVPDAAMSLRVEATRGCLQYLYEEDIWGVVPGRKRTWTEPLRITLGPNALAAFKNYYASFPGREGDPGYTPVAFFNTWGLWREKKYTIAPIADFARKIGASMVVLDDGWEVSQGSGIPYSKRFPSLDADLAAVHDSGMTHGVWETLGWISDTAAAGLTTADLIVGRNGRPCRTNWNFDPASQSYYCLDISSARAREFLKQRTIRTMKTLKPSLLKLDFGYGFPSPAMGVPRDPRYRGERQYTEFVRLIAATAKSVDPSVKIMYYGISPLCVEGIDIVSLDDQGDLWYDIAGGHGEWSVWASLLSDKKVAVTGSSGYTWEPDEEVILNTAIIGSPGANLPILQPDGQQVREKFLNRRLAINTWFRRTILWQPLWLNSRTGNFDGPPRLNSWGRMEKIGQDSALTSLVLRGGDETNVDGGGAAVVSTNERGTDQQLVLPGQSRPVKWKGRWALISQDDASIFAASRLAMIPFDAGEISIPYPVRPAGVARLSVTGQTVFDQWEWNDGWLTIRVSAALLENTAGFLVNK